MSKSPGTVALIGNLANNFYREARALRLHGFSADLFEPLHHRSNTRDPKSDPGYREEDNDWIHRHPGLSRRDVVALHFCKRRMFSEAINDMLDSLATYDLVLVSGSATRLIPAISNNVVWRVTGEDLTVQPSLGWIEKARLGKATVSARGLIRHASSRRLSRRGTSAARFVCVSTDVPHYRSGLRRARIDLTRVREELPLVVFPEEFSPTDKDKLRGASFWPELVDNFVVFWPSRMMFSKPSAKGVERRTGQWKKSEAGFDGFREFLDRLDENARSEVQLAIPDRPESPDIKMAHQKVSDLGLHGNVKFIRGRQGHGLTRTEMVSIFAHSSVVMNHFGTGSYGSVAVEAAAAGLPVINYVPDEYYPNRAPTPFLSASEPHEIASQLYRLWSRPSEIESIGKSGRTWCSRHHGPEAYVRRIESLFAEINDFTFKS